MAPSSQVSGTHKIAFRLRSALSANRGRSGIIEFSKTLGIKYLSLIFSRYPFFVPREVPLVAATQISFSYENDKQHSHHPPHHLLFPPNAVHLRRHLRSLIPLVWLGNNASDTCCSSSMGAHNCRIALLLLHLCPVYAPAEPQSCASYTADVGGTVGSV